MCRYFLRFWRHSCLHWSSHSFLLAIVFSVHSKLSTWTSIYFKANLAFVVYLSLNVHNLLMIKFSGIVTSKFTIGAIVLLTLKNVTSIQSKTLERIDVPP